MSNASRKCDPCGYLVLFDDWDVHLEYHDIKNADKIDFSEWCHWIENYYEKGWNYEPYDEEPFDDIPY